MTEIPLFEIEWDENDITALNEVIRSGRNWAIGQKNIEFENLISKYLGTKYCVLFNSGTSALHGLLLAYNLKEGSEIIVPSFTFIATVNSVLFTGAKPILADIERETLGLDPNDVLEKINDNTKAILPIHYAGCPCQIKTLREIAEDHNLLLLEDAAESLGATVSGQKVGSFGDSTMLSFCQNKIITTGEGGCIATDTEEIYQRLKLIRSHGRSESKDYFSSSFGFDYVQLGYNFRMPNILAALGVSQINKVDKLIKQRQKVAQYYTKKLEFLEAINPFLPPKDFNHVYQLYTIFIEKGIRDDLIQFLSESKIGNKIYFSPVHLTQFYKERFGYSAGYLPVTEEVSKEVLSLPMYPTLSNEKIDYIVDKIEKFFQEKNIN